MSVEKTSVKKTDHNNYTTVTSTGSNLSTLDELLNDIGAIINQASKTQEKWKGRIIQRLGDLENKLDKVMPDGGFQQKMDAMGRSIEAKFAHLKGFNEWLNDNGQGEWVEKLATFLCKLPVRSARNVLNLLYNIIREILCSSLHPTKIPIKVAKLLITLTNELTKPEVWSKMGIGIIGSALGMSLASGSSVSTIALGIGGAMLIAGLTVGPLTAAVKVETGKRKVAAKNNILSQVEQLPESMLTGFLMGLIMGGIQRAIREHILRRFHRVTDPKMAEEYVDKFIKEHGLPKYDNVELAPDGKIVIRWSNQKNIDQILNDYPEFRVSEFSYDHPQQLGIILDPSKELPSIFNFVPRKGWWDSSNLNQLPKFLRRRLYPPAPIFPKNSHAVAGGMFTTTNNSN